MLLNSSDRYYASSIVRAAIGHNKGKDVPLFPELNLQKYELLFRRVTDKLKLKRFRVIPHTIRHSGPSWGAFQKARTIDEIQSRGRWACMRSVLRYKKPGRLLLETAKLEPSVVKLMKTSQAQMLELLL